MNYILFLSLFFAAQQRPLEARSDAGLEKACPAGARVSLSMHDSLSISGCLIHIEKPYGNAWTNINEKFIKKAGLFTGSTVYAVINGETILMPLIKNPTDVEKGRLFAYINSHGMLSFAVRMGNFSSARALSPGTGLKINLPEDELADVAGMAVPHAVGGAVPPKVGPLRNHRAGSPRHARIFFDIRYASASNFTGKKIYPVSRCLLRRKAANALLEAADSAGRNSPPFSLCVLDCYRPLSVQKIFWDILPDTRYVAAPATGSRHNRGMAVDVTACDLNGKELKMPSGYDDFSEKAHRKYAGAHPKAIKNRKALEQVMIEAGFIPLKTEWWHFDYPGWERMEILDIPLAAD